MRGMPFRERFRRSCYGLAASLFIALSLVIPGLAPLFSETASAEAGTRVDISLGGRYIQDSRGDPAQNSTPLDQYFSMATCIATLEKRALTDDVINQAFNGGSLSANNPDTFVSGTSSRQPNGFDANARERYNGFVAANKGNNVSVITFKDAPSRSPSATASCNNRFIMIPVESFGGPTDRNANNPKVWLGYHHMDGNTLLWQNNYMRFTANSNPITSDGKSTAGTLAYYNTAVTGTGGNAQRTQREQSRTNFVIEGVSTPTGPVVTGNVRSARFVDASTIEMTIRINGNDVTETYIDPKWDARKYYFLASSTNPTRNQLSSSAQGVSANATPLSGGSNRTPFIHLGGPNVNLSFVTGRTTSDFQNGIRQLGNDIKFYDYDATGAPLPPNPSNRSIPTAQDIKAVTDRTRSDVWFYYSQAAGAATTVFGTGDGNEQHYAGTYAQGEGTGTPYLHAATNCASLGELKIDFASSSSPITKPGLWTLKNPSQGCAIGPGFGEVRVSVVSDDTRFNEVIGTQPSDATLPSSSRVGRLICDVTILNPVTWLMCPIASAATAAVDQLDSAINDMLNINAEQYFGRNDTGDKLYEVWSNMRIIAMGIIVVFGLFVVIAQASGWEAVSPYALKKGAPKFIGAVILLAAWWPIGVAIAQLGDVATYGIRELLYAPFGGAGSVHIGQGTSATLALLGTGTILALGIFGTLTFAISAFFAVAIGYLILLIRLVIVIGLHTTSAIFIPFYAFPNTQPIWKFFWGGFTKAVAIGPVLAGAIAFARIMSWIIYRSANGKLSFHIMAVVCYFGIYFLLFEIVTAVGGFAAMLAGRLNDSSRGVFDALKNTRRRGMAQRGERLRKGTFFNDTFLTNARRGGPLGAIGRFGNRMGHRYSLGARNQFGFGDTGRAAMTFHDEGHIDEELRNNHALRSLGLNDDNANAVLALSGSTRQGALKAMKEINQGRFNAAKRMGKSDAEARATMMDAAEQRRILSTVTPFLGNRLAAAAAGRNMMQNKARGIALGDWESIDSGMNRLAEGNEYMAQTYKSSLAYFGRASGRVDLGGEWTSGAVTDNANILQAAASAHGRAMSAQDARSHATMLDGIGRTDIGSVLRAHPATFHQMASTIKTILDNVDETMVDANGNEIGFDLRQEAAMRALELQKGISNGMISGDAQKVVNKLMEDLGINMSGGPGAMTVATQLATKVTKNTSKVNGAKLWAMARAYDQEVPEGHQRSQFDLASGP